MILDTLYRVLLRLLPRSWDRSELEEMWDTYRFRVERTRLRRGRVRASWERLAETADLLGILVEARSPLRAAEALLQDLRFARRSIVRNPLTSLLAVASLALGIGAATSIFSAVDVWLLRPLPIPDAERLVGVGMANRERGWMNNAFSLRDWWDWSRAASTVELMAYAPGSVNLAAGAEAERADVLQVSANALGVLGIRPALGRGFTPEEGRTDGPRVVVLSDAFWRASFGADPGVVGRTLVLDAVSFDVVGVLPPRQGIPGYRADLWLPLRISGAEPRSGHFLQAAGRLADGVGMSAAASELDAVAASVAAEDPERTFPDATVRSFRDAVFGREYRQGGLVLGLAVLLVLLIACANIANLLLARGIARSQEMAVRGALGAGRSRLVGQLLVESSLTATAGGLAGILVASLGVAMLRRHVLPADSVAGWEDIAINGRVLVAALALTVVSTLVFGLFPALRASRVDLAQRLTESGRDGQAGSSRGLGSALVVAEIALSLVLVVLSALMIRSIVVTRGVDVGMRTEHAFVFRLDVPTARVEGERAVAGFYAALAERVASLPDVSGVATSSGPPLRGWSTLLYSIPGVGTEDGARRSAEFRIVTPSYREVLDLRMVAGRWLDDGVDVDGGPPVAVIGRALGTAWWSDAADAIGHTIRIGDEDRAIVGVVESGRLRGPGRPPPPTVFVPFAQAPRRSTFNIVTHDGDGSGAATAVREVVRELDPELAVFDVQTMQNAREESLGPQTAGLRALGALGAIALLLTLVGVYGVAAHSVGRRRREMGLRMAIGADAPGLVRMVLVGGARTALIGVAIGTALSLGAGQAVAFLLVGVGPREPVVLASVAVLLLSATLVATWIPARRAARVDPARTLRGE